MGGDHEAIAAAANRLAAQLPAPLIRSLAGAIAGPGPADWPSLRARVAGVIPHASYRPLALAFLGTSRGRRRRPGRGRPGLLTAADAARIHRDDQRVEFAGPARSRAPVRSAGPSRRSSRCSTRRRAGSPWSATPSIACPGSPGRSCGPPAGASGSPSSSRPRTGSRGKTPTARSGPWARTSPPARRSTSGRGSGKRGDDGRIGILHVKCAVADGRCLFLSSANLTEYAFTRNMELGLLITGGELPGQVEAHFDRLVATGTLAMLSPTARS